jgi:hypothetical protein
MMIDVIIIVMAEVRRTYLLGAWAKQRPQRPPPFLFMDSRAGQLRYHNYYDLL